MPQKIIIGVNSSFILLSIRFQTSFEIKFDQYLGRNGYEGNRASPIGHWCPSHSKFWWRSSESQTHPCKKLDLPEQWSLQFSHDFGLEETRIWTQILKLWIFSKFTFHYCKYPDWSHLRVPNYEILNESFSIFELESDSVFKMHQLGKGAEMKSD